MLPKIVNGKVELRKNIGILVRNLCHKGAVVVNLNADVSLVLLTLENGEKRKWHIDKKNLSQI